MTIGSLFYELSLNVKFQPHRIHSVWKLKMEDDAFDLIHCLNLKLRMCDIFGFDEHNFYRIFSIVGFLSGYFPFNENNFNIAVRTFYYFTHLKLSLFTEIIKLQNHLSEENLFCPSLYLHQIESSQRKRKCVFVWRQNNLKAKKYKSNGVCLNFNYS